MVEMYNFFIICNSIFEFSLELLRKEPKMRLKVYSQLVAIVVDFEALMYENRRKIAEVGKLLSFSHFQAQQLLAEWL